MFFLPQTQPWVMTAILSWCLTGCVWAQQPAAASPLDPALAAAIKQYESGDARSAIYSLNKLLKEQKENADAWHVLGMAQYSLGSLKEARKAFEKTVALRPTHAASRTNLAFIFLLTNDLKKAEQEARTVLKLNPNTVEAHFILGQARLNQDDADAALEEAEACLKISTAYANIYWLKTQALLSRYADQRRKQPFDTSQKESVRNQRNTFRLNTFNAAAESLGHYLDLKPELKKEPFWQGQLEALQAHAGISVTPTSPDATASATADLPSTPGAATANTPEDMTPVTRPTILYREKATYTEEARRLGVQGVVVIQVIFDVSGKLKHPLVLRSLGHGLDEAALRAAAKIRFTPSTRNGKPISVVGSLEYSFNLY
jgi:TonB family protein